MQKTESEIKENYRETELGLLPESWDLVKLGDIAEYINGFAFKPSDWKKNGLPIIRIQNLTNSSDKINYYDGQLDEKYKVKEGDLLISWSASLGVFKWNKDDAWLNQHIFKVDNIKSNTSKDYLFYVVMTRIEAMKGQTHGSTMHHITKKEFLNVKIPLPPLSEQQKIAYVLSTIQNAKEKTENTINALKELKKSMMKHLFTYGPVGLEEAKKVKLKETEIGLIPEDWDLVKLKDISNKITDGTHRTPTYIENGIPFLRVTDIQGSSIDWKNTKYIPKEEHLQLIKRCKPEKGDILLSKNGTIGLTKVIDWDREFSIFVSLCLIKPKHDIIKNYYLANYLSSEGLKQIKLRGKRMTVTNLHLVEIKELLIPLPPLVKQQQITNIFREIENKIEIEQTKKNSLNELFKSMLHNLMTAKIRVNDLVI